MTALQRQKRELMEYFNGLESMPDLCGSIVIDDQGRSWLLMSLETLDWHKGWRLHVESVDGELLLHYKSELLSIENISGMLTAAFRDRMERLKQAARVLELPDSALTEEVDHETNHY